MVTAPVTHWNVNPASDILETEISPCLAKPGAIAAECAQDLRQAPAATTLFSFRLSGTS